MGGPPGPVGALEVGRTTKLFARWRPSAVPVLPTALSLGDRDTVGDPDGPLDTVLVEGATMLVLGARATGMCTPPMARAMGATDRRRMDTNAAAMPSFSPTPMEACGAGGGDGVSASTPLVGPLLVVAPFPPPGRVVATATRVAPWWWPRSPPSRELPSESLPSVAVLAPSIPVPPPPALSPPTLPPAHRKKERHTCGGPGEQV